MSFSVNNIKNYSVNAYSPAFSSVKAEQTRACSNSITASKPSEVPLYGKFPDVFSIKNFKDVKEQKIYNELSNALPQVEKKNLEILLKTGKLLNKNSNDGSSTLDNLYKILKTPRTMGLSTQKVLSDTISTLANPFRITQKFGDIPPEIANQTFAEVQSKILHNGLGLSGEQNKKPNDPQKVEDLHVDNSGCCVAASIEFNLADKKPAEFARYAAGLTSPENSVKVQMKYSDVSTNFVDALNFLKKFNLNFKTLDWNSFEATLEPDREAIIRARVQNTYQDPDERNTVDSLMQSTFMQIGSQATYNSLTDKRYGSFNSNDKGLTELEKNFTETIVDNNGAKTSVTYQDVDENARLIGYTTDYNKVLSHLQKTLEGGANIIIGITEVDDTSKIIGGHEITITDMKKDNNGEIIFVCNDTDDDYVGKVEYKAIDLIPKIHHAGIPNKILDPQQDVDSGFEILREYEKEQKQTTSNS